MPVRPKQSNKPMFVNDLLICCQNHAWEPRFLNPGSATLSDPELDARVTKESQTALEHGQVALALDLINLALRAGRQSIELLQTKAAALQHNAQGSQPPEERRQQLNQEVLVALRQLCIKADWQPRWLADEAVPEDISAFETLVLKELEALRDEQRPELALQLADAALAHGFTSLWLHHNKALAHAQLKQFNDAHQIWAELCQHTDIPDFVAVVREAFEHSQQREHDLANRGSLALSDLHRLMAEAGWTAQHLPATSEGHSNDTIEVAILQEAETTRNEDQSQLSLQLLDCAIHAGFESLWLLHNKALALAALKDFDTAIEIWTQLSSYDIDGFSQNVTSELERAQQNIRIKEAEELASTGNLDLAINKLATGLCSQDNRDEANIVLKRLLRKRRSEREPGSDLYQMADHLDQLELNQLFLEQANKQLKAKTDGEAITRN
jgi:hypothetical protein